jgi:hypothetical protein
MSSKESLQCYFQELGLNYRSKFVVLPSWLWKKFYGYLAPQVSSSYDPPGGPASEHYLVADELANHYGNIYRSSFLANYLLAATAVFLAMLGPLVENWGLGTRAVRCCTIFELLTLLIIYVNFHFARKIRWHDKFTDYRMLAEQLRHLEFVVPLGFVPSVQAFVGHDPDRPNEHWTTWHVRNLVRQLGIVTGNLNSTEYRGTLETTIRDKWIKNQIDYHLGNADRCEILERKLHGFAIVLFWCTVAACIGHLLEHLLAPEENAAWVSSLLTLLAAVCPAWAASAHAIGQFAELRRLQRRSRAMAIGLAQLTARFDQNTTLHSRQLNELAFRAAEMMLREAFDWRIQYRMSVLIPG